MPAPHTLTAGQKLRVAADQLYELAERVDIPMRSLVAVQQVHDEIETVAGDVRAVVRGQGYR